MFTYQVKYSELLLKKCYFGCHACVTYTPFNVKVFGVGVPNPYRLRPFIGARVPVNSSFSPLINIHNPYSEPLQVIGSLSMCKNLQHLLLFMSRCVGSFPPGCRDVLQRWRSAPGASHGPTRRCREVMGKLLLEAVSSQKGRSNIGNLLIFRKFLRSRQRES